MSAADKFLPLVRHRFTGKDHGVFHSPTRDDRNPSCTFKIEPDGRILICDHGGASAAEIVAAVGLELSDLFPEKPQGHRRPARHPFSAADCLRSIALEGTVVLAVGAAMMAGEPWDRERLVIALERVSGALSAAGLGVINNV